MNYSQNQECEPALTQDGFLRDMLHGLSQPVKRLPCKYLYDEEGARLFEVICQLEEYYPTRTELGILQQNVEEIASLLGPRCVVIDLGSGSGLKTRLLLDHLPEPAACVPIDVSHAQLLDCAACLARDYPGLAVLPICADYTTDFEAPEWPPGSRRIAAFFPGSTIGNFEPEEAARFLRRLARLCGSGGGAIVGVDLKKDPALLHSAYNDAQGVTAAFNLNLLARANRELQADFDLSHFQHRAIYNEEARRVELHLISRRKQVVSVGGKKFHFASGESVVTEHSYKYALEQFRQLAQGAGFRVARVWTDEHDWFSVQYLVPSD